MLYSVRSERMLMEQLESYLLFRRFVGLSANQPAWRPTAFTKNRDRLIHNAHRLELSGESPRKERSRKTSGRE